MILFSVAVHEDVEIVYDIISNISAMEPNSIVVFHCSAFMSEVPNLDNFPNAYINNMSSYTGYMDGSLLYVHLSNFRYAVDLGLKFDYFAPFGSNQMLVKSGLYEYISGAESNLSDKLNEQDIQVRSALLDSALMDISLRSAIKKGAPEGTFYSFDLIRTMYRTLSEKKWFQFDSKYIYGTNLGYKIRKLICGWKSLMRRVFGDGLSIHLIPKSIIRWTYATEEVYFPTCCFRENKRVLPKYCYIAWKNENLLASVDDIKNARASRHYYAVKRVERDILDPVRKYIHETSS
ncbi:hypothetical protein [Vibrio vulnificus]|uniref:hypothetical protein n=1 Tax=Vibrio vulnificus TaxID=672 RepID=UPI0019D4B712|nr:hypothetical protein [Vibrio vulnificus]MBN8133421.1 hypothetical protein [Vibrio vulnificus]MBN8161150.1 hypothetical protein [Vibrio vulnificus]